MAVLRALLRIKILVPICLMVVYTATVAFILAVIDLWNVSLLKDTIVWFCFSAMAMMMRFMTADDTDNMFGKTVSDSVRIVIVVEFLVNTYTFSLPVEIVTIPILALIAVFDVVASTDKQYEIVAKLMKGLQVFIGFIILAIVLKRAVADLQNINSLDTIRSIVLAPCLSLIFFPFLYVMVLISKYELVFLRLTFGPSKNPKVLHYARRSIILHAGLNLRRVQCLLKNHVVDLMHIQTNADVDRLVKQMRGIGSSVS